MTPYNEAEIRFEELEVRMFDQYPDPFPLYPHELLSREVTEFALLKDTESLVLQAIEEFQDERYNEKRFINDEYLFKGPGTYIPRVEEVVKEYCYAMTILPGQGLVLLAKRETIDSNGNPRVAGEKVAYSLLHHSGCTPCQGISSLPLTSMLRRW